MAQPRWVTWLALGVAVSLVATVLLRAAGIPGTLILLPFLFGPLIRWNLRRNRDGKVGAGGVGAGAGLGGIGGGTGWGTSRNPPAQATCPSCGRATPAGATFCPYDGTRL
ncbi:MAG: hypothetical protein ACPGQL_10295 [Thermoplasmatota archaeon]